MTAPVTSVWRTWRLAPRRHLAGALLSWVSALVPGVQVVLTAAVVDAAASLLEGSRSTDELVPAVGLPLVGLLVAQLVGRVLMALSQYLLTRAGLDVRQQLAEQTMTAGLAMSQPDFENPEQYNRAKRALQEVQSDRVSSLPGDAIELVAAVVSIVSVAAALFAWMPVAAVLILLSPVPGAYAAAVYGRKRWALDYEQAEDRRFAAYLQALTLSDHSHKEIAHYRVGALLRGRFTTTLSTLLRADVKTLRANHVAVTIGDALGILLTCAALALVVLSVAADPGSTTLGMLTGFVQGMNSLYGITLTALAGIAAVYQSSLYADNVFSYLDDAPEYPDRSNVVPALAAAPTVGLSDVRFAYPGTDGVVLNGVDLEFPAGLFTVVVGQNGSGKSTLLKLISALYSPTEGRIEFDGRPLDSFDLSELRASIGVVYQDYVKYELSAYDNVAFGRVEQYGDEAAVLGALDTVDMGDRIRGLSRGLETRLGRRFGDAEQLSTGQWQRLAFARAFRADPRVLLADEPSASLDAAGEHAVLQAVLKRRGRTTTVMVSHSLAAIHAADLVVFVDKDGGVRGPGSHESLRELSDQYRELYAQLRENADSGALSEQ